MKKSKIFQIGSSQELYMHPNILFVAHFICESNLLEPYITQTNGKYAEVELREGLKINAIYERDTKLEERVILTINPETRKMKKSIFQARTAFLARLRKPLLKPQLLDTNQA